MLIKSTFCCFSNTQNNRYFRCPNNNKNAILGARRMRYRKKFTYNNCELFEFWNIAWKSKNEYFSLNIFLSKAFALWIFLILHRIKIDLVKVIKKINFEVANCEWVLVKVIWNGFLWKFCHFRKCLIFKYRMKILSTSCKSLLRHSYNFSRKILRIYKEYMKEIWDKPEFFIENKIYHAHHFFFKRVSYVFILT